MNILQKITDVLIGNDSLKWCKDFQYHILPQIKSHYREFHSDSNLDPISKMKEWRTLVQNGTTTTAKLLPQVFGLITVICGRILGLEHFDVQFMGGAVLHEGKIAQMSTGEGKTLVVPLAAILNSLEHNSILVVTANYYLAKRDAELLKPLYEAFGLSVGYILDNMNDTDKKNNYKKNIIYSSHSVVVFDYLRDCTVSDIQHKRQPIYSYIIIDEIDQALIDSARTPRILSGTNKEEISPYYNILVPHITTLQSHHYKQNQDKTSTVLTNSGWHYIIKVLKPYIGDDNIFSRKNISLVNIINNLVTGHFNFHRNYHYLIMNDEVILIDQLTHRHTVGQRLSHGLHQAIEALNNVTIKNDTKISASTSYFDYIKLFDKVSGLTATATHEREEFHKLYNLDIIIIPTNKPVARVDDQNIVMYRNDAMMHKAVVNIINNKLPDQPLLICTPSVDRSIACSMYFNEAKIPHKLLNAQNQPEEAEIIKHAGLPGMITVTTGMAGRGTDIQLDPRSLKAGGLYVMCLGIFQSNKVEQQIRGRSGRQGHPGYTQILCSRDDTLIQQALPKQNSIEGVIAHNINFIDDKDIYDGKEIQNMVREVQGTIQTMHMSQRESTMKLNPHIDTVKNPGIPGNISYRDIILTHDNTEELYNYVVHQFLKSPHHQEYSFDFMEDTEKINYKKVITDRLVAYFSDTKYNPNILLKAYDHAYSSWITTNNELRVTSNSVSYGQDDPIQEYTKLSFKLFQELNKTYAYYAIKYLWLAPQDDMSDMIKQVTEYMKTLSNDNKSVI